MTKKWLTKVKHNFIGINEWSLKFVTIWANRRHFICSTISRVKSFHLNKRIRRGHRCNIFMLWTGRVWAINSGLGWGESGPRAITLCPFQRALLPDTRSFVLHSPTPGMPEFDPLSVSLQLDFPPSCLLFTSHFFSIQSMCVRDSANWALHLYQHVAKCTQLFIVL